MNVKIDTKEKFTVITPTETELTVIMTADANDLLLPYIQKDIPHIVLNLQEVKKIDEDTANFLADIQQTFYENDRSFVICCMQHQPEDLMEQLELLEIMNTTPSESEAWDIVQMEEIERELLSGD